MIDGFCKVSLLSSIEKEEICEFVSISINKKPKVVIGEDATLRAGDIFLLASDGMWAYFEDAELTELLHELTPREASERMVSLARERAEGRGDNLSVAIIKLEPQPTSGRPAAPAR